MLGVFMNFIHMALAFACRHHDVACSMNGYSALLAMNGGGFYIGVMTCSDMDITLGVYLGTDIGALAVAPLIFLSQTM